MVLFLVLADYTLGLAPEANQSRVALLLMR